MMEKLIQQTVNLVNRTSDACVRLNFYVVCHNTMGHIRIRDINYFYCLILRSYVFSELIG